MKNEKLIFLGWNAYGDFLSYNGLIRFMLKYYDIVYIKTDNKFIEHLTYLYNDVLDRVHFLTIDETVNVINNNKDISVLNSLQYVDFDENGVTSKVSSDRFGNLNVRSLVDNDFYFNGDNKISDFLNLESEYTENKLEYIDNASNFYVNLGLNPDIRYNNFFYNRNLYLEDQLYKELLLRNNINENEEYAIICEIPGHSIKDEYKKMKNVNINYCTNNPLRLIKLLENAKEIHLIDDSHVLFFYYLYMSNTVKIDNINVHIYSRNRFEYYYKMFMNPKIETWKIIF